MATPLHSSDDAWYEQALDELESVITRLTDEAIAAVQHVPFAQSVRDELITLAEYVSWRTV